MHLVSLSDVTRPTVDDGFRLAELAAGNRTSILHYTIEPGVEVPRHQHEHEQLGYVFAGKLTFILDNGTEITAGSNDSYAIDANEAHAAANRGDETVLGIDIFSPPRTNPDWEAWVAQRRAEVESATEGAQESLDPETASSGAENE